MATSLPIHLYLNATAGAKDGVMISEDGAYTNPIKALGMKPSSGSSTVVVKVGIRCEDGIKVTSGTICLIANNSVVGFKNGSYINQQIYIDSLTDVNQVFDVAVTFNSTDSPGTVSNFNLHIDTNSVFTLGPV